MLYVPFLDPRNPERMKLIVRTGRTVRVEYLLPGKTRTVKFTMLASDYDSFLGAASAQEQPVLEVIKESDVPVVRRGRPPKSS